MSMDFTKFHNKILVHMKTFDVKIDHILVHFVGSKLGLYVSFRIPLQVLLAYNVETPLPANLFKQCMATQLLSKLLRRKYLSLLFLFFFKAVFYITGGVSILWCILWFIFLSDEPRDHKCISEKEINFIETNRSAESIDLDDKHQETKVQVVYPKLFQ